MAVTGFSLSERFSRWQVLANNLKESQRAAPAISEELTEIDALLAEARTLQDRQAQFRSQAQEITKRLRVIAAQGDRIRSRMGAILQGKLGFTNEELIRYGFRPKKLPPKRRVVVQAAPGGPQPGTTPPAGAAPTGGNPSPGPATPTPAIPVAPGEPPAGTQPTPGAPRT
jgi:hypothetical protein